MKILQLPVIELSASTCWYYESEGVMGPHVNFTPKLSKLNVHLGYMQVPLSSNFLIIVCSLWASLITGLHGIWNGMMEWKMEWNSKCTH